jgi:hypothetical protein
MLDSGLRGLLKRAWCIYHSVVFGRLNVVKALKRTNQLVSFERS